MNFKKIIINTSLIVLAIAPPILYSFYYGPDPGYTGAPGDNPTGCVASSCHVGTVNSGPGSITITASGGNTYTPGQTQQISIKVTDATMRKYGFQLSARVDSDPTMQSAGMFNVGSDGFTQIVDCSTPGDTPFSGACPDGNSLTWIEQTLFGFQAAKNKAPGFTYTFTWTPPATDVGTVTLYAAGNAGPGNTVVPTGTNVYMTSLQLSPPAGGGSAPAIQANGIHPNDSAGTTIQPGSWVSIYGANLAPSAVQWKGNFPTTLGGTTVSIDGKPAYLSYVSPSQINLQAPDDGNQGTVNVTVTNGGGSVTSSVTLGPYSPAFCLLDATHVAAIILRSDGSGSFGGGSYDIDGPTGTSLGYKTVAAKAGDQVVIFGVGFGPTSPFVPAGQSYSGAAPITGSVQITINSASVTPAFAGLSGAGLYQFNVTIPAGLGPGDVPLTAIAGGVSTQSGVVLSLQ